MVVFLWARRALNLLVDVEFWLRRTRFRDGGGGSVLGLEGKQSRRS